MTINGIKFSFSQFVAQTPIIKPNKEKLTEVKKRIDSIHNGCSILKDINNLAVNNIIMPINTDLVAAAPTYPTIVSNGDIGAESIS